MFTNEQITQITEHGVRVESVERQLESFRSGFPFLSIQRSAVRGDGILQLSSEQCTSMEQLYQQKQSQLSVVKFVPASGAATRMFKGLYTYLQSGEMDASTQRTLEALDRFAFADALNAITPAGATPQERIEALLSPEGLNYGALPKALLLFHRYPSECRTPLEEHLSEGARYGAGAGAQVQIHFTLSPEHEELFKKRVDEVIARYEAEYGVKYTISYSQQLKSTDTIAVTPDNRPFINSDNTLLFRPAGHGALIENLNAIDADVIFIKTVDNVLPDTIKADTIRYKRALAGVLLSLQERVFDYLRTLDQQECTQEQIAQIAAFISTELGQTLPEAFNNYDPSAQISLLHARLNRPMRVCGMVPNEGEPGGGPFWVYQNDGSLSLQIAESSQIAPTERDLMAQATHFNPVDLVCGVRDYRGEKFDLRDFVDPQTGFISEKSKDGAPLKAMELPGLWNGAMARWNTLFVEVPITTFAPVKEVGDLLRPQHQVETKN